MKRKIDYSLYLCTDRGLMSTPTVEEAVEQAILGGCTLIQLREKDCSSRAFCETACSVKAVTDRYNTPLIINDRPDIALAVGADGVHVGQSDLPCKILRRILGEDKIIGVSASTLEEAVQAEKDGADYLSVGAMYATGTKTDAAIVSMDELLKIRRAVSLPIVVIGGINRETAPAFRNIGVDGLAVVSAIIARPDIRNAARELLEIFKGKSE
ncbi:thiamine phosphate synthase [Caproiciproducens galactitolivorans]|uniref:thiamine phosphate synthase n=1 Tax=Caproiciproducens galactitolivorans TaxID=642589 RepID=UPI002409F0D4|nr:thiamine phosphate synthase [Caproiciproducens galactitolivorans]